MKATSSCKSFNPENPDSDNFQKSPLYFSRKMMQNVEKFIYI